MKFGHSLIRSQVPEWADYYINYKKLKKLIKTVVEARRLGEEADLAEFFFCLDRNLEKVDSFYNKKFSEAYRVLKLLENRYGRAPEAINGLDHDELEELLGALLDLRGTFRKLQWFGEINRRGFVKITKKLDKNLDKKGPHAGLQSRYISTKVDPKPFANDNVIAGIISEVNKWLSATGAEEGAAKHSADAKNTPSTKSLGRASDKALLSVSPATLNELDKAVKHDDGTMLERTLREAKLSGSSLPLQTFLLNLLQRCISTRAKDCIFVLLMLLDTLDEPDDINKRNCIHRLVIHIGRSAASSATNQTQKSKSSKSSDKVHDTFLLPGDLVGSLAQYKNTGSKTLPVNNHAVQTLIFLLDSMKESHQPALVAKDAADRMPLHYAAQYGCVVLCEVLQTRVNEWNLLGMTHGDDPVDLRDKEGHGPLAVAVLEGHVECAKALVKMLTENVKTKDAVLAEASRCLAKAAMSNSPELLKALVQEGANVNWQDDSGETALHVAARYGHVECAQLLVEHGAEVNIVESTYGWTPLHVASVGGDINIVQLLVKDCSSNVSMLDSSGWNAKEHAALRGHLRVAEYLATFMAPETAGSLPTSPEFKPTSHPASTSTSVTERRFNEPVKSFGHRYLGSESLVMVSLGSMDMRKKVDAVAIDHVPGSSAYSTTQLGTSLSIVVSASGATGEPASFDLPVHENISTEPITFLSSNPEEVRLMFDIVPTYALGEAAKHKLARAVALLKSIRPQLGSTEGPKSSLVGEATVPLLQLCDGEVVGTVHFNVVVVTPFHHRNIGITSQSTYWKKSIASPSEPMVIGHRGLGKNVTSHRSLQLGENTVQSFIAAANLGANYVEFDVQVTKDGVPVIYHDFYVSETGIDAPVHTLTLEQFMHMNQSSGTHSGSGSPPDGAGGIQRRAQQMRRATSPPTRSHSYGIVGSGSSSVVDDSHFAEERMKHTLDFKTKGFKANSRGKFIQAPFATLQQLFEQVPEATGFNIELKYPMVHESQEHDMDAYAVELNSFVDTVLRVVYDNMGGGSGGTSINSNDNNNTNNTGTTNIINGGGGRRIIFSSFNPDVCLCLALKQPSIPVLFLTDATADDAVHKIGDVRASSLQEAIRFAGRWNLLGIVAHAEVFAVAPRLIRVVKEMGLVCVSYGVINNDPANVQVQVAQGIDAVIVDSVLAIRRGLTASVTAANAANTANAAAASHSVTGAGVGSSVTAATAAVTKQQKQNQQPHSVRLSA